MLLFYLSLLETEEAKSRFELLYNTYRRLMYTASYEILKDHYLCEDALHEAFIRIMKNMNGLDEITCHKTRSFVVIVAENESKRLFMKRKKNAAIFLDDGFETIPDFNQDINLIIDKADEEVIVKRLKELSKDDAEILTFKYFQELKDKEIASLLKISNSAVRKRLERARKKLAVLLNSGDDNYD